MKTICVLVLCCLNLLLDSPKVHAADSTVVVVLSRRVGAVIDSAEAEQFRLFRQFKNFQRAKIFKLPGGQYYARVWLGTPGGAIHDTVAEYSGALLHILAEKIEHYESLKDGSYHMGDQPPKLMVIEGSDSSGVWIPQHRPVPPSVVGIQDTGAPAHALPDLLPFAGKSDRLHLNEYPNLGFGAGISTFSPDLSGLNKAVGAIQYKYEQQGYIVGSQSPELALGPLLWFHLIFRANYSFALLTEAGSTVSKDDATFYAVTASLLYYFKPLQESWFRPYAGVGFGTYRFSIALHYGARVSPTTDYGSYSTLDQIVLKGERAAPLVRAGLELSAPTTAAAEVFAVYTFLPALETVTSEGILASAKLGSLIFGVRITLTF